MAVVTLSISTTLADSGVAAGTYPKVTVDAKVGLLLVQHCQQVIFHR